MGALSIGLGLRLAGSGGVTVAALERVVTGDQRGPLFRLNHLLGASSTFSVVSGSSNIAVNATTGEVGLVVALGDGGTQDVVIRETLGLLALEFPLTIRATGTAPPVSLFALTVGGELVTLGGDYITLQDQVTTPVEPVVPSNGLTFNGEGLTFGGEQLTMEDLPPPPEVPTNAMTILDDTLTLGGELLTVG